MKNTSSILLNLHTRRLINIKGDNISVSEIADMRLILKEAPKTTEKDFYIKLSKHTVLLGLSNDVKTADPVNLTFIIKQAIEQNKGLTFNCHTDGHYTVELTNTPIVLKDDENVKQTKETMAA